jgi:hypothetical protein
MCRLECAFHKHFEAYRLSGTSREWFHFEPVLRELPSVLIIP